MIGSFRQREPDQSRLEELGYRVPSESGDEADSAYQYEDGEMSVVCPECGAENDPDFTYCRDCSAELPQ